MNIALTLMPRYPWEAVMILSVVLLISPFLISRYRSINWQIPNWHLGVMILLAGGLLYYFYLFQLSIYSIDQSIFAWDIIMQDNRILEQNGSEPIEYSSFFSILIKFLQYVWVPATLSLAVGTATFWVIKFGKYLKRSIFQVMMRDSKNNTI